MRKVKRLAIIFALIIIGTPITIYGYVKYQNYSLEKETYTHLINIGYKETEIIRVESKIKKLSLFTAEVTFNDEPGITYDYKKDEKEITQIGPTIDQQNYKFNHLE